MSFALPSQAPVPGGDGSKTCDVFEKSALPVFFWNLDNRLVDTNQAGVDLLGYPREAYHQGRVTWRSITPPGCESLVAEMCARVFKEGAVAPFEWGYVRADGRQEWTQIVVSRLPGSAEMGLAYVLDMTPQRIVEREMLRAQDALRQRERSLRLAIQAGNLGTWDFDPATKNLKWSRRCQDIFGIGPRQMASYAEFIASVHPGDRKRLQRALNQTLDPGGIGNCELEFRIIRKSDQTMRWVMARAQAFFGERSEQPTADLLIGTLLDVTQRKSSEAELRRARDIAEAANAAKDQFIAKLSHELRTPLTPVLMGIDMLLDQIPECSSMRQDLLLMQRNVQLEARIIDDLLDVTRINHGKLDLHLEEVDVHQLLEEAVEICMPKAQENAVSICFRLDAREHWTGGDSSRLEQVFWNLLQNATKFTPPGGVIQISTSNPHPGRIVIAIRDSGIGIEPKRLPELFNAFEQGGASITRRYGGLGLGLAICKGVIELHSGSIRAFSEGKGTGATFFVNLGTATPPAILPCPKNLPKIVPPECHGLNREKGVPIRLLVVEDHPHTGDMIARLLRRAGYAVCLARSLADAKKLAASQSFELVISDIGLPDGTGRELMAFLRETYGLQGIALSGFGTEQDIKASLSAGFKEHVIKPVAWKQLEDAIQRVLKHA
jgi:PAS domain S-box-containing protein